MNRNIDDVLAELLTYYDLVRGVGHTTVVIRGAQNVERATTLSAQRLCVQMTVPQQMSRGNPTSRSFSQPLLKTFHKVV